MSSREVIQALEGVMTSERVELIRRTVQDRTRYITVALEDIYQPHNASAVIRTCDCFGIQDVHIIENQNEYTLSENVALGSSKWVDMHRYSQGDNNTADCLNSLKESGYLLVGTSPHAREKELYELSLDRPIALLFGSEGPGLSEEAMNMADVNIRIPMVGFTESFNISVSAAIILHHLTWRMKETGESWRLSAEDRDELHLNWLKKSVKGSPGIIARLNGQ